MLNLSKNNVSAMAEAGYEFELVIPGTDEGTGGFVKVRGVESKIAKQFARKMLQEQIKKEAATKNKDKNKIDFENIDESMARTAYSRIISWRGISIATDADGKDIELELTEAKAMMVLMDPPWIGEQILEASNEVEIFRH